MPGGSSGPEPSCHLPPGEYPRRHEWVTLQGLAAQAPASARCVSVAPFELLVAAAPARVVLVGEHARLAHRCQGRRSLGYGESLRRLHCHAPGGVRLPHHLRDLIAHRLLVLIEPAKLLSIGCLRLFNSLLDSRGAFVRHPPLDKTYENHH